MQRRFQPGRFKARFHTQPFHRPTVNGIRTRIGPETAAGAANTGEPDCLRAERHHPNLAIEHVNACPRENRVKGLATQAAAIMIPHHGENRQTCERQHVSSRFRFQELAAVRDVARNNKQVGHLIEASYRLNQIWRRFSLDVQISDSGNANHWYLVRTSLVLNVYFIARTTCNDPELVAPTPGR
jgi:hypothetical protein